MEESRVEIDVPQAKFTLFDATRSGKPEVVVVNEALLAFLHLEVFPWHLLVTLEATELVENGMPSQSESEVLFRIGDEIEDVVLGGKTEHGSNNALFLARSTWDGRRELMFQVHNPEVAHSALQALLGSREWERAWEYRMESDLEWSNAAYLFALFRRARGSDA
jgi:Family of unknown function (DUF695)